MAKSTTNYEVVIGTGDNDSDSSVEVALVNAKGDESEYRKPADYGGDNRNHYEKGSIEICTDIPYTLDGDPVKVSIRFGGKKWRLGGIWVTNQSNGKAWYNMPNENITSKYTKIDLLSLNIGASARQKFDRFAGKITTGSDGTDNKVSG